MNIIFYKAWNIYLTDNTNKNVTSQVDKTNTEEKIHEIEKRISSLKSKNRKIPKDRINNLKEKLMYDMKEKGKIYQSLKSLSLESKSEKDNKSIVDENEEITKDDNRHINGSSSTANSNESSTENEFDFEMKVTCV